MFDGCSSFKSIGPEGSGCDVEIPSSVTTIGSNAFSGCKSLETIELSNSIKTVGIEAFSFCDNIKYITIMNPSITFEQNNSGYTHTFSSKVIEEIFFNGTITQWNRIKSQQQKSLYTDETPIIIHCTDGDVTYSKLPN